MHSKQLKGLALFILAISQLMMALDYTIIFVAMPSLGEALGFSANHLQWVISAYSLVFGGFFINRRTAIRPVGKTPHVHSRHDFIRFRFAAWGDCRSHS